MWSRLFALIGLGLCLSQRILSQKQTLPKPIIWAKPPFMVPKGSSATIWCQGTRGAVEYRLYLEESLQVTKRPKLPGCAARVEFLVEAMTSHTVGTYKCFYRSGELWSEPSAPLDLVMTGMYDTPTLSVHPRPEVAVGENLTFYCRLETATGRFFLLQEGRSGVQPTLGDSQGKFPLGPATAAHKGAYRCFGSYNSHLWSFPSEPVTLLVAGDSGNTSQVPTDPTLPPDSRDPCLGIAESGFSRGTEHRGPSSKGREPGPGGGPCSDLCPTPAAAHNLFRIGMAILVLGALAWFLLEGRFPRKKAHRGADRASRWQCRRFRVGSPHEEGPRAAAGSEGRSLDPGRREARGPRREAERGWTQHPEKAAGATFFP